MSEETILLRVVRNKIFKFQNFKIAKKQKSRAAGARFLFCDVWKRQKSILFSRFPLLSIGRLVRVEIFSALEKKTIPSGIFFR